MHTNYQTRIPRLYRYLAPVYGPIRPYWTKTANRGAEQYLEERLSTIIRPDTAILDLGCGPACNLERLRRLNLPFARYVGFDLSPAMLARRPTPNGGRAYFALGDAYQLPFADGSFDVVLSTWMFSHLRRPRQVVQAVRRLLRPDGWLVATCFTRPGGLTGALMRSIEPLFLMHCIPWRDMQAWPGLVEVKHFLGGANVVVCLRGDKGT